MDTETWYDRNGTQWASRPCDRQLCEECEADTPAIVEVSGWAMDDEPGGWNPLCEEHYQKMRADPFHNPPGSCADRYVNLGEVL